MAKLILASASPRRKNYLSFLGLPFEICVPNVDESHLDGESPEELVLRLSKLKAHAVANSQSDCVVIAADTVVAIDNLILGKPKDDHDAFLMLKRLQGKTHTVLTGTTIESKTKCKTFLSKTLVTFASMSDELIKTYIASGECKDKTGSYALQGIAAMFIKKVEGSVSTVVGLPICEVRIALEEFGITPMPLEE